MWKSQPTGNKLSVIGAWSGHVIRYKIFGAPIIITGTVESKVVKFCTRVGYINSSNRMTYHQQKGCGYGHGTVLNFCHLSWCSVARVCHSSSWRMSNSWKPASSTEACLLSYCDLVLCITTVSTISRAAFQMNKVRPLPARFSSSICPGREPLVTQAFVGQMPSCHVTDSSDTNCPVLSFLNLLPDCWRKGCCSLYAESLTIFPLSLSLFLTGTISSSAISFRKCVTHLVVFTISYHPLVTLYLPSGSEMLPHILDLVTEPTVTNRSSTMLC